MIEGKQHIKDQISALAKQKTPFLFVINFDGDKAFVEPIETCAAQDVLFKVRHLKNYEDKPVSGGPFTFTKFPISFEKYQAGFDIVQQAIADGNTYLINLTYPTRIETSLSLKEIFFRSNAKFKLFFKDKFVVFSPETFVRIRDQKIYSYPMKGTIDATIPDMLKRLETYCMRCCLRVLSLVLRRRRRWL